MTIFVDEMVRRTRGRGNDTIFGTNTIDRINGNGGAAIDSNYDLERKTA